MPQLLAYRVAIRAAQFALAAAAIVFLLLFFSRQAHAATGDERPGGASGARPRSRRSLARFGVGEVLRPLAIP